MGEQCACKKAKDGRKRFWCDEHEILKVVLFILACTITAIQVATRGRIVLKSHIARKNSIAVRSYVKR